MKLAHWTARERIQDYDMGKDSGASAPRVNSGVAPDLVALMLYDSASHAGAKRPVTAKRDEVAFGPGNLMDDSEQSDTRAKSRPASQAVAPAGVARQQIARHAQAVISRLTRPSGLAARSPP